MKKIEISIFAGLIIAIVLMGFCRFSAVCDEIRQDTLRLHILANSDSEQDQQLKIKVRDAILTQTANTLGNAKDKETAIKNADSELFEIAQVAKKTIQQQGYDYAVKVYRTNMFFDTRYYADFTLPAGNYDAIRVEIGAAEGKNWWCVLFPPLCVPAAEDDDACEALGLAYSDDEQAVVSGGYEVRFAIIEWLQSLKNKKSK